MIEGQKAAFSFETFRVPKFAYNEGNHNGNEIKIKFLPSGQYNSSNGEFELTVQFISTDISESENRIMEITAIAMFKFDEPIEPNGIPSFFYQNSIAIMFPYIRAFISTLTLQANTKLLQLGLMNLSSLEPVLRKNTIFI